MTEKERLQLRLQPETREKIQCWQSAAGCRSMNEKDKNSNAKIEDEQEEHHAKTVDDLRNGKVIIVVILNLCFDDIFPCLSIFV